MKLLLSLSAIVLLTLPLQAGSVPAGKAEDAGMSTERLGRIREAVQRHIDNGNVPGAVTIVARNGRIVHFEAHGLLDVETKKPMPKDAIFRLASTSKPVAAVSVMMMVEEGKIRLTDPISRFIPEFANMKVAVAPPGGRAGGAPGGPGAPAGGRGGPPPPVDLVTANRQITVKDLLTHGSGIMSGGLGQSQAGANGQRRPDDTLATYIPRLAAIPIDFQPGTLWRYSGLHGLDIAARIVEIASGQPYNVFLKQRLFDPLGMKDTGFALPAADPRLVPLYTRQQGGGFTRAADQGPLQSATYFSASGGLVSTIEDYLQFAQMLVNGGELNGRRYLSPRTVSLIASNHTGNMLNGQFGAPAQGGIGFGLGVQVVEDPVLAGRNVSKGAWGWAGAYGTNVHIEPAERMVQIIFMNVSTGQLQRDFEAAVQQAIVN
jgi:CubicO group peptidase (beta-lactamase class C family)